MATHWSDSQRFIPRFMCLCGFSPGFADHCKHWCRRSSDGEHMDGVDTGVNGQNNLKEGMARWWHFNWLKHLVLCQKKIILLRSQSALFKKRIKNRLIIFIVMWQKVQLLIFFFTFPPGKNHRLNFPRRDVWPIQQQQKNQCVCQLIGELLHDWYWGISVCKRLLIALLRPRKINKDKQTGKPTFDRKFRLWKSSCKASCFSLHVKT